MKNLIANRYLLTKQIGQGGMADVYTAVDTVLNREVAVKILRGELRNDPVSLLRFQREAVASTSLNHPNVVEIFDVGEEDGHHFIVMEYVKGLTLKQLIASRGALCKEEAVDVMKQLVDATAEAHRKGIIHRDIKPQNVLTMSDGTVKVADFGIALAQGALQLTQSDAVMGSVHYLAPELARGEPASVQSDIYALGIVFYELLSGEVPFQADTPVQVALAHMREEIPSVRALNPSIPQSLENIIMKATVKNKALRYATCSEMLKDLQTCLSQSRKQEGKIVFESKSEENRTIMMDQVVENSEVKVGKVIKKRKPSIVPKIIGGILSVFLVGIVVLVLQLSGVFTRISKPIEVPTLVGMTVVEAKEKCTQMDLVLNTYDVVYKLTENTEKGKIVEITPSAGTAVGKGTKINIVVSSGIGKKMKDYVGYSIKEAKAELSQFPNMRVIAAKEALDNGTPGKIFKQELLLPGDEFNPAASSEVRLIYVPYPTIAIPHNVEGMTVEDGKALLESMGAEVMISTLDSTNLTEAEKSNLAHGIIVRTKPSFGVLYTQEEGAYVTLYAY